MTGTFDATAWTGLLLGATALFAGIGALRKPSNPWIPSDLLACALKAMGGLMMFEALAILGFCDIYTQFWLRSLSHLHRGWAASTALLGVVLIVPSLLRFQ